MALQKHILSILLLISIAFFSCKEKYVQPIKDNTTNYLVVEGLINTDADSTIFNLSRTFKLDGKDIVAPEKNAIVQVESDAGGIYLLPATIKSGRYGAFINIPSTSKYRLRIRTIDKREYLSEFIEAKISPPFELKYDFDNDALNFHVDAYDPSGKSIYYNHSYEETWEYESQLISLQKIENGILKDRIFPQDIIHVCWRTLPSPNITLTSTANLSEDRLTNRQLVSIPGRSQKLHIGYSILVKQSVLTAEAFAFWETLRNNTEKVGSVFDVQPSQLFGNIKSITDPTEKVIGFVSAGTVTQKRIQTHVSEFPVEWFNIEDKAECLESLQGISMLRTRGATFVPVASGQGTERLYCADCRLLGGTLKKPSFWK